MLLIRYVVSDIDGTITDAQKRIQVVGIRCLREVQERGVTVSIASGNVLPLAHGIGSYIGAKGPVIAENGGILGYQEKIYRLHSNAKALRAYQHLKERMPEVERLFTDNWRETEVALKPTVDPARVRAILKDFGLEIEVTGFAIHMMEPGQSKLEGVKKACELLALDLSEVAAFGDSDNDAKMLAGVGFGVAVGNASPAAKSAAKYVASGKHSDGVEEGLKHLGLLP
ncbi:MAG TPA: phosphoglycolate phosphatase [Methanomassiliicoccales archaeon]|nr:phosphoglycolate phosphatase [Methanomassiliicoccales archaeon]